MNRRTFLAGVVTSTLAPGLHQTAAQETRWPTRAWAIVDPADVGMSADQLALADQQIVAAYPDVTGVVVVRGGAIAFERYYGSEYGRDDPVKIRSITKSVTGTLIGMAIDDGLLRLDSTLGNVIPDLIPADADPLTPAITVENLLTMTSGWAWDIHADYPTLIAADDYTRLTLSLPVAYEPGTVYAYNTGGSHLLSVIIEAVTGDRTVRFADKRLFGPLGIDRPRWERSPEGPVCGGFGLELTPRDLARFGMLALRGGEWDGERLVSADWVTAATSYQSSGDSTGYAGYGYQWWVIPESPYGAYFGLGFGSNYLYNAPTLDLIVVILKGFETPPNPVSIVRPLIEGWFLPAVTELKGS
jgi:CubicO group peptidase (beta-lactamase class C family)